VKRPKLLLMTNMKLHMRFRLASRSMMTLDDLELLQVRIFGQFRSSVILVVIFQLRLSYSFDF